MKLDIACKEGKILVSIELVPYGRENNKKQKYYRSSVEQLLTDRGLRPGVCYQNSVIHNMDDKALSGKWVFEDLEYIPKPKPSLTAEEAGLTPADEVRLDAAIAQAEIDIPPHPKSLHAARNKKKVETK